MQIRLVHFKEGVATPVHESYNPKTLDVEFVDYKFAAPVEMDGTVEKSFDTVTFRGRLSSKTEQICGRCLKSISSRFVKPFELFYEIQGREIIETLDDLREALILDHPISFVCSEQCKGLCPKCGANWNTTKCSCKQEETKPNSPFAILKKLPKKK